MKPKALVNSATGGGSKTVTRAILNFAAVEEEDRAALLCYNPDEVCRNALVQFDKELNEYVVRSYGNCPAVHRRS